MRSLLLLFFIIASISGVYAQVLAPGKYWIPFTDKNNSPYTLQNPEAFLTDESINRRMQHNISITLEDIPVNHSYLNTLDSLGFTILGSSKWLNAAVVETNDTALINKALELSFVLPFHPKEVFKLSGGIALNFDTAEISSALKDKRVLSGDYGKGSKQIEIINGRALHDLGFKGMGMKMAVLDAGFYRVDSLDAFNLMRNEKRILGTKDFVNLNGNVYNESTHGLSVLSTISSYIPGELIGTAPDASVWLLRTEDAYSEYRIEEANWLMAAEYADSAGAHIITSSLGYNNFTDTAMNYGYQDMNGLVSLSTLAANKAFDKGMIVIVSAGNEGNKAWEKITAPSDGFNVIAVGAIDTLLRTASFSSRGPTADNRIKPDVMAVGFQTMIVNSLGSVTNGFGTSYAAPQIAGMTACLWQAFPHKRNIEIIQAIRQSSNNYSTPTNDYGYGIPDFFMAYQNLLTDGLIDKRISLSPNPVSQTEKNITVSFDIPISRIEIISITGQKIASISVKLNARQPKDINIQGIAAGIYLLRGTHKKEVRTSRFIIQ
jgi:serine protease AprX